MTTPESEIKTKTPAKKKTSALGARMRANAAASADIIATAVPPAPKEKKAPKVVRVNFYLPPEMADAIRDAVYHIGRGHTLGTTMADFVPGILAELEEKYNDGKPFPQRPPSAKNLTTGPPVRLDRQDSA